MENILDYAKKIVANCKTQRPVWVDFTMGNGNDTLFLSNLGGKVYAFDIQQEALDSTQKLLDKHEKNNVELILDSHANLEKHVFEEIDGGIFNLGYLPKGDKNITTLAPSTIKAIESGLKLLKVSGILCIVVYVGHEQGAIESQEIENFVSNLDIYKYNAIIHRSLNHKNAPYVIAIKKRKE